MGHRGRAHHDRPVADRRGRRAVAPLTRHTPHGARAARAGRTPLNATRTHPGARRVLRVARTPGRPDARTPGRPDAWMPGRPDARCPGTGARRGGKRRWRARPRRRGAAADTVADRGGDC
ncbi:hypothetical protein E2C00_23645 [Streptomyces sp. WAC05374]|nr:hypothetical protein EF905_26270 [Streptomyces sp. WAC05374]TDF42598.1 hypothetical protein E2B92_22010 [Streptomyces sp. WAC05374]TDF51158.1 hypothetical protein E2C02_24505 [Streptomyces sp. WAC05374]TDF52471.1 hypothetical protein E2C00_23645 [Streptomyces sp. WAC05374]